MTEGPLTASIVQGKAPCDDLGNDISIKEASNNNRGIIDEERQFKFALKFFRDFDGKAFTPSYDNRNKLVALSLQVKYGKFIPEKAPGQGALDLVGRDRRAMWQALGDVNRNSAMKQFVDLLSNLCPLFQPYIQAHMSSELGKEKDHLKNESNESKSTAEVANDAAHSEEEDLQKKQIQAILNQQTYQQFLSYAEMQYPGQEEKQMSLIKQLQEQHYQQYMQQMLQQQFQQQEQQQQQQQIASQIQISQQSPQTAQSNSDDADYIDKLGQSQGPPKKESTTVTVNGTSAVEVTDVQLEVVDPSTDSKDDLESESNSKTDERVKGTNSTSNDGESEELLLATAQMWTRKDVEVFRESIRKDGNEGQIKIGHGEVVTIQVPTHPEGSSIYWEFCTDSYDIAFGLLFEWTDEPGTQVSVHVSEDSEDEDDEDLTLAKNGIGALEISERDAELALESNNSDGQALPQTEVLIPIVRRNSHLEVFTGSHVYPGKGKYLLKFDNSYSMWRSKNLYYRVYYTR